MRRLLLVFCSVLVSACAAKKTIQENPAYLPQGPVELRLKGQKGEVSQTFYHSESQVSDFEGGQKIRDHQEGMDFIVRAQVMDTREHQIAIRTETVEKDGQGNLHEFALPEPGEQVDFVY